MNVEIMYATKCEATIYESNGDSWSFGSQFKTLKDALEWAQFQIEVRPISFEIARIYITDSETGEILASCSPDELDPNPDHDEDFDCGDWDYNEDMGFDPYMGCYSEDC